jgi:hypothetical protein
MQERLALMLADMNSLPVRRWIDDPKEKPFVGETVGLMLQLMVSLMGEMDVFIGSEDLSAAWGESATPLSPDLDEESGLLDLNADEPASLLNALDAQANR